jgi:hypothetical protein
MTRYRKEFRRQWGTYYVKDKSGGCGVGGVDGLFVSTVIIFYRPAHIYTHTLVIFHPSKIIQQVIFANTCAFILM